MYKSKNIALCIVFSFITCGIYGLYWLVCMADDVNTVTKRTSGTSGGMVLLFSIITCGIYSLFWLYKAGEAMDLVRTEHGEGTGSLAILYLVLGIFGLGIVSYALLQSELNKYATDVVNS